MAISALLSIVPTLKSTLESAIIDQIDGALTEQRETGDSAPRTSVSGALREPVDELSTGDEGGVEGAVNAILDVTFTNAPLWGVMATYAVITLLSYLAGVWSTALRARITRTL